MACVGLGNGRHGVSALHHIAPGAAVHMQVDETGQDEGAAPRLLFADGLAFDGLDSALRKLQFALHKALRCEDKTRDDLRHAGTIPVGTERTELAKQAAAPRKARRLCTQ